MICCATRVLLFENGIYVTLFQRIESENKWDILMKVCFEI